MTAYDLPDWAGLALALADGGLRNRLDALLRLHHHLSRVVLSSKEPALVQIRLAWWREELRQPSDAGQADPLLGALKDAWSGEVAKIVAVVDAWEGLLGDRPWPDTCRRHPLSGLRKGLRQYGRHQGSRCSARAWPVLGERGIAPCWIRNRARQASPSS